MNESPISGGPGTGGLVDRVKAILLKPAEEWPKIAAEPHSIGDIYKSYVLPLAAIGPVAGLIGSLVFGYSILGITYRPSITSALSTAVFQYVATLIGVFLIALLIDFLAPRFGGTADRTRAFKVAAYTATAGWVAGIFGIIPMLGMIGALLGLYGLYLMYLGLPVLMKSPPEKTVAYMVTIIVVAIVATIVLAFVLAPVRAMLGGTPSLATDGAVSGSLSVPGVGAVDLGKLEEAGKKMEQASKQLESGVGANGQPVAAVAPDILQSLLPASLGALPRTEISSAAAAAGGIGGSNAEARYGNGDADVTLKITDLAAMGGLAAMGTALNVQSSRQTATGYERTQTVDGRMTSEKWDNEAKNGTYSVLVGNRFMVEADGTHVANIDALKAAVNGVDFGKLESAAN